MSGNYPRAFGAIGYCGYPKVRVTETSDWWPTSRWRFQGCHGNKVKTLTQRLSMKFKRYGQKMGAYILWQLGQQKEPCIEGLWHIHWNDESDVVAKSKASQRQRYFKTLSTLWLCLPKGHRKFQMSPRTLYDVLLSYPHHEKQPGWLLELFGLLKSEDTNPLGSRILQWGMDIKINICT